MSQEQVSLPMAQRFKTAVEAVAWLKARGWKCSKASFSRHMSAGNVPTDAEGCFTADALLGFASVHLKAAARLEDAQARDAAIEKMTADSQLKAVRAEREKLRLEKERGLLMAVARHEAELAARAVFFRSELESFMYRAAGIIIELVHGDDARRDELIRWWQREIPVFLDAYAQDREFLQPEEDDDTSGSGPDRRSLPELDADDPEAD